MTMGLKINELLPGPRNAAGVSAAADAPSRTIGPENFSTVLASVQKKPALPEQSFQAATLKFSAHAQKRLASRNIEVTPQILNKLNSAVQGAANKGSNNSLILLSDLAFIVNVPNRTVITAVDGQSMKDNVFTQIDSAVIIT
jgi:flagellar operon protein